MDCKHLFGQLRRWHELAIGIELQHLGDIARPSETVIVPKDCMHECPFLVWRLRTYPHDRRWSSVCLLRCTPVHDRLPLQ